MLKHDVLVGEYVIMVEDVTNPPFMGFSLEPAFAQVKVFLPKKPKKEPKPKKEKEPRFVLKYFWLFAVHCYVMLHRTVLVN